LETPHKSQETPAGTQTEKYVLAEEYKIATFVENKLPIYKAMLMPVWTYGVELWEFSKPSKTKILQTYHSKTLRMITGAPRFVSNLTLHNDLKIPSVHKKSHSMPTNTNYAPLATATGQ
jgi:hypothetical protein